MFRIYEISPKDGMSIDAKSDAEALRVIAEIRKGSNEVIRVTARMATLTKRSENLRETGRLHAGRDPKAFLDDLKAKLSLTTSKAVCERASASLPAEQHGRSYGAGSSRAYGTGLRA